MLIDRLKQTYLDNKSKNPLVVRSLLKEVVQFYILDFVFNSKWGSKLIFKGGTCLRFCFDLPRLSEDLDFDIEDGYSIEKKEPFNIETLASDIKDYFVKKLQFPKLGIRIANNQRTIYLKFPILSDLGMSLGKSDSVVLHVRIDLALAPKTGYKIEVSVKSSQNLSFLIRRYSPEDLFAGKISAILTREKIEGTERVERFKGRDYYDLIWFLEKGFRPNWKMILEATGMNKKEVLVKLNRKIKMVTETFLKEDLLPFFENQSFVEQFAENFHSLANRYVSQFAKLDQ
ncbi:MAG: hypothetical protein A2417_03330 [Bdellovibrionales bacterium RIFOXYC1_FULL_37_79]|nr:MAG: hypothetical protein A2417_03330 [Bdellovibrionales bacterium RIFOXYC1_FULL_37_79]